MSPSGKEGGFKPVVIEGGKSERKAPKEITEIMEAHDYNLEERLDSNIKEEKIFSIEEILGHIKELARREGLNSDYLEIVNEVRDKEGNLIILRVGIKASKLNNLQRNEKWGHVMYDYMLKGRYGKDSTDTTCIIKGFFLENVGLTEFPNEGVVAEYKPGLENKDGQWEYYIQDNL